MSRVPWGDLLRVAAIQFSLAPADFWMLSIWEWKQLVGHGSINHAGTTDLQNLITRFPDRDVEDITDERK